MMTTTATAPAKPAGPDGQRTTHPTLGIIFLGLVAGLQLIDPAIANTAIVEASKDIGMTGAVLALAASVSTLALAATVLPLGYLADRFGRRQILMISMLLAIVGDVIVALSPSGAVYLGGRAIAGVGVGGCLAAAFAYVRFVARPGKVPAALGLWNLSMMAVFIIGSLSGGALADQSWRLAMLLVPALALVLFLLTPLILAPMPKIAETKADYPGMLSIAVAMVLFLYGVAQASKGLKSVEFLVPTLVGLLMFAVYYVIERRSKHPIFPPSLFLRGVFAAAVVSGIAWNFAQAVVQLQTSNYWQYVQGFGTSEVALGQVVMLMTFAIGGVLAGRLMRPGVRTIYLMGFGFLGLALPMIVFGFITVSTPYWMMGIALFIMGFGLAFVSVPQSALFVAEAKPEYFGPVTAFRTTSGQLGYALGFAVSTALVNTYGRLDLIEKLRDAGVAPSQIGDAVSQVVLFMQTGQNSGTAAAQQAISKLGEAYSGGFAAAMVISGFTVLFLAAITLLLLIIGLRQETRDAMNLDPDGDSEAASPVETEATSGSGSTGATISNSAKKPG